MKSMKEYEKTEEETSQLGKEFGAKFDSGKSRWDLIPADVLLEVSKESTTFIGLYQRENKIKSYYGKMLFHYANGMEAAWNFWDNRDSVPYEAAVRKPLIFGIISYIHLLDLALLIDDPDGIEKRHSIYREDQIVGGFVYLPYRVLNYLGDIYLYGCKKYDENNWRKGMKWGKIFGAFNRHSGKWFNGEIMDDESGMHHLGHALWQLFGLRWLQDYKPEYDDRWK